jgi:hypothetical protein
MKDLIGKFVSFKYRERKDVISGFLIDFNDDWTLIKYNPVDYVIDGYLILKTNNILKYIRGDFEEFREKVLRAKNIIPTDKDIFPITNLSETLQLVSDRFGAFKIEKKDDTVCFIGRLVKITKGNVIIREIDAKAKWVETEKYQIKSIRTIEFDSDYVNSLVLYSKMIDNV